MDKPIVKRPRGRPKGSKNATTVFKEAMQHNFEKALQRDFQGVLKAVVKKAKEGDMRAAKILFDRVVPVSKAVDLSAMDKKGLQINITVGDMEKPTTVEAVEANFEEVE